MESLANKSTALFGPVNELAHGVAAEFQNAGSKVTFLGSYDLEPEASDLGATIVRVDLDDPVVLAKQLAAAPAFDIAIFHPEWYAVSDFMDTSPAEWNEALRLNFERVVYASQASARALVEKGTGGRMIFLSSFATRMPFLQSSVIGTTLSALESVARMAAVDLGPHGITVNVVTAGWTEADWAKPYLHADGRDFITEGIPMRRFGRPSDIGAMCRFLASDAAAYVTGAVIPVDGGYTLTRSDGVSPYPEPQT